MEYIVEKIGMSRTITVPSTTVTLLKLKSQKYVKSMMELPSLLTVTVKK